MSNVAEPCAAVPCKQSQHERPTRVRSTTCCEENRQYGENNYFIKHNRIARHRWSTEALEWQWLRLPGTGAPHQALCKHHADIVKTSSAHTYHQNPHMRGP